VISGKGTSESYMEIVSELGMKINLGKTLISENSFEFAKRFYVNNED
jgi:hypothetical protein